MGTWEEGHERASRGVLETVFRRQRRREKVVVGPGSRECKAGYETKYRGKLRVRWRWLVLVGK